MNIRRSFILIISIALTQFCYPATASQQAKKAYLSCKLSHAQRLTNSLPESSSKEKLIKALNHEQKTLQAYSLAKKYIAKKNYNKAMKALSFAYKHTQIKACKEKILDGVERLNTRVCSANRVLTWNKQTNKYQCSCLSDEYYSTTYNKCVRIPEKMNCSGGARPEFSKSTKDYACMCKVGYKWRVYGRKCVKILY